MCIFCEHLKAFIALILIQKTLLFTVFCYLFSPIMIVETFSFFYKEADNKGDQNERL